MNIQALITKNPMIAAGAVVAVVAALWIATRGAKQAGQDVGGGAVNLLWGAGQGAGGAIVDNLSNPSTNPLYGAGAWLGDSIFWMTQK
jgi:hypothetical protein